MGKHVTADRLATVGDECQRLQAKAFECAGEVVAHVTNLRGDKENSFIAFAHCVVGHLSGLDRYDGMLANLFFQVHIECIEKRNIDFASLEKTGVLQCLDVLVIIGKRQTRCGPGTLSTAIRVGIRHGGLSKGAPKPFGAKAPGWVGCGSFVCATLTFTSRKRRELDATLCVAGDWLF